MRHKHCLPVLFALLAIIAQTALVAQTPLQQNISHSTFSIYLENDVFANTDQNYTHGCGVSWISSDFLLTGNRWRMSRPFFGFLSLLGSSGQSGNISLNFRQNIYTPGDISTPTPIINDEPYAGLTFFAFGFHAKSSRALSSLELDIGMVGPHSYADRSQKKVHQWIQDQDPKGWDNQIGDELIVNLNYERRWRMMRQGTGKIVQFDLIPLAGYGIGNMKTFLKSGGQIRVGWHLPSNFGSYVIQPGCECQVPAGKDTPVVAGRFPAFAVYLFTGVEGQLILRYIVLDGNTFRDSNRVDKNRFTGEVMFGFGVQLYRLRINYSFTHQSKTFKTQKELHKYGGITFSWLF